MPSDFEYFETDEAALACAENHARQPAPNPLGTPALSRDLPYKAEAPRFTCHGHRLSSLYRRSKPSLAKLANGYSGTGFVFHLSTNTQNNPIHPKHIGGGIFP